MEYQVLARKYRPKTFTSMMGQEHVLKALANALETERLHHAYLFTGTRGVGKTTVARVLAKALNCEQGITAEPCGKCAACQEIDQGRFVDLIEVDAASRTRVEDTRELLDNVQYAPTRGRFKIYLIDEVHMLSGHSFNALLKTLEEPPPHVKFLLATTDPQKLPVTILSRCLQFNLKRLNIEQLEQQMQTILQAEKITYEEPVLKPLAIAADGSMRDALSLLDQAIAYCNGSPNLADVEIMLGSVHKDRIYNLLAALANNNGAELITQSRQLTEQGLDVNTVLAELISMLQRIALSQTVPDILDDSYGDKDSIEQLAQFIAPEDVQLYYQIALNGRKDLPFSPQPQGGFEMILLRMLAFRPAGSKKNSAVPLNRPVVKTKPVSSSKPAVAKKQAAKVQVQTDEPFKKTSSADKIAEPAGSLKPVIQSESGVNADSKSPSDISDLSDSVLDIGELPPVESYGEQYFSDEQADESIFESSPVFDMPEMQQAEKQGIEEQTAGNQGTVEPDQSKIKEPAAPLHREAVQEPAEVVLDMQASTDIPCQKPGDTELTEFWCELIKRSGIQGFEQQLAKHCALVEKTEQDKQLVFELLLESVHQHLLNDKIKNRLQETFQAVLAQPLLLRFRECQLSPEETLQTPRRKEILEAEALQKEAVKSIYADQKLQMLVRAFDATIREESIKPLS